MENYTIDSKMSTTVDTLLADKRVLAALAYAKTDAERTLTQQLELAKTPAPTFHEEQKTQLFRSMLVHEGLENASIDHTGPYRQCVGSSYRACQFPRFAAGSPLGFGAPLGHCHGLLAGGRYSLWAYRAPQFQGGG